MSELTCSDAISISRLAVPWLKKDQESTNPFKYVLLETNLKAP